MQKRHQPGNDSHDDDETGSNTNPR